MRLQHYTYCLLLTLAHLLYTLVQPSIIAGERSWINRATVLNQNYVEAFFRSRNEISEFARRPLTTWFIELLSSTGLDITMSFVLVEYLGIFIALLILFRLAFLVTNQWTSSYLSVALFAGSFWFVHAFFTGIYAYDEPWQYVFLFAALTNLVQQRLMWFSVAFFMALIARESSALLLPGIYLFLIAKRPYWSRKNLVATAKTLWIIPAYLIFLGIYIQWKGIGSETVEYMGNERFGHLYFSFANSEASIDSLTSLALAVCIPFVLLLLTREHHSKIETLSQWKRTFWLSLILNTVVALTMTMGREGRIFAQPVVLMAPFLGFFLHQLIVERGGKQASLAFGLFVLSLNTIVMGTLGLFSFEVYWPTDTRYVVGFQHYAFITLTVAWWIGLLKLARQFQVNLRKSKLIMIGLTAPLLLFWNMQRGYKFHGLYENIERAYMDQALHANENPELVVATHYPHLVEQYFADSDYEVFAANFNHKAGLEDLERIERTEGAIFFVELEPTDYYAATFALSTFGRVSNLERIDGHRTLLIHQSESRNQQHLYALDGEKNQFVQNEIWGNENDVIHTTDEYSPSFKASIDTLGIDSLYSYGASVRFKEPVPKNAQMVMHVESKQGQSYWRGQVLREFEAGADLWQRAYMADFIPIPLSSDASISFYIWNPDKAEIAYSNLEVTLKTPFVSKVKKRPRSEATLNLR